MKVRHFSLINNFGITYSLTDPHHTCLFTDPTGLGYEDTLKYVNLGDVFVRTNKKPKQGGISGKLIFGTNEPYKRYQEFIEYIRSSDSLKLIYGPPCSTSMYYRDVEISKLTKTEREESGVLSCSITFQCSTLFYRNINENFVISTIEGEMRYAITFPANYNDYAQRSVSVTNDGDVEAALYAELNGYCEYPTITVKKNGKVVSSVKIPRIVQADEKILYSSIDDDMYVYHVDEDGTQTSLVQDLDINADNFFKLPTGDCEVEFSSDTGAAYKTSLTIYKFYRTV